MRRFAFLAALPAVVGAWLLVGSDSDIGPAMAWLLIPALASGFVLSVRFVPLRFSAGDTARMNGAWKRTFIDVGWLALGYLAILLVSAVATQFVDADLSAYPVAAFIAFIAGGAALLGVLASFLVLLPLIALVTAAVALVRGRSVNGEDAAGALLLFSVAAFATSLVLATTVDTGASSRGRAWTAVFVLLTGIQSDDAHIDSEPFAWAARIALAAVVGSVIWLGMLARRRKRRTA